MKISQNNKKILMRLVATQKIYSKEILFKKMNKELKDKSISISSLSKYIKQCDLHIDKNKKYYTFKNKENLIQVKKDILSEFKKDYNFIISEPMLLSTSILNDSNSIYLIVVYCKLNYEKIISNKLSKFINPISYTINSKSIFFYFNSEKLVRNAYNILNCTEL